MSLLHNTIVVMLLLQLVALNIMPEMGMGSQKS